MAVFFLKRKEAEDGCGSGGNAEILLKRETFPKQKICADDDGNEIQTVYCRTDSGALVLHGFNEQKISGKRKGSADDAPEKRGRQIGFQINGNGAEGRKPDDTDDGNKDTDGGLFSGKDFKKKIIESRTDQTAESKKYTHFENTPEK